MKPNLKEILKVLRVLYIDDRNNIPNPVQNMLKIFFKDIYYAKNIDDAMSIYNEKNPDIIISETYTNNDVAILPILKEIRQYNHLIPIIITSSHKEEQLLFDSIRLQPIDFVTKPLSVDKFIYPMNEAAKHILHHGNITITIKENINYNYINKTITIDQNNILLTKNESRFLELLLANNGKTVSKDEIEFYIWGEEYVSDSALKSLLKRLRDKLDHNLIKNSPGIGYSLLL